MAVFESGLFSRLSGSFGNVTMYRLGDSNVVKGKRWARDARTPSQLIHRAKWKVLGLLAMRMKKVLELGFPGREARGRVNGFMSRNLPCMACDEGLNVSVDYIFLWNPEVLRTNLLPLHQRKETAEVCFTLPEEWKNTSFHIYAFAVNARATKASETLWLGNFHENKE